MELQLNHIQEGIEKLKQLHQESLNEVSRLKKENDVLRADVKQMENRSTSIAEKNLLGDITSSAIKTPEEKKQMKLKINELVREVDKCIALLNQ